MNLRECYYMVALDGTILERNRVTLSSIESIGTITRYIVSSARGKEGFLETYKDLETALGKFIELSN